MCTLILLRQVVPDQPLLVASNRDEYLARPATPPHLVEARRPEDARDDESRDASLAFVGPQDLEAGGTWIGVNAAGVFIGLTNRPATGPGSEGIPARDVRSRGLLVRDLLRTGSAARVREIVESSVHGTGAPGASGEGLGWSYRPFHLVACDADEAFQAILTGSDARPRTASLPPGIHVVCNRDESDPSSRKVGWIRRQVEALDLGASAATLRDRLIGILGSHPFGEASVENPCVHGDVYGTRSSTVFACAADRWQAWHAEGAPCQTKYENYTPLLDRFQRSRV